ncbi:MAG: energy transducer TonB [Reyranellaceae bacterium]
MAEEPDPGMQEAHPTSVPRYREPLSPAVKLGLLVFVLFCHVGGGWALTMVDPVKLVVGDVAPMEVRMVDGAPAGLPEAKPDLPPDEAPPLPEMPPDLSKAVEPPPPEPPPPDMPMPQLATAVEPPPPDLPPPAFPVPPPPPKPVEKAPEKPPEPKKAEPPKPRPAPPKPAQAAPATPGPPAAQPAAPAGPPAPSGPRTVTAAQLGYVVAPNPVYPQRSRRAGEEGKVMVRVLVDVAGRPAQVSLQASSGHGALDEAALSAVRAAQFRPYAEAGVPQAVWVLVPINFVLR